MVSIFTGVGTGFERGSGSVLGSAGLLGSATQGTGGAGVFFNAATGNLLISQRDEYLVGRGPDAAVSRTYNSLGDLSDDNGDNWRQSTDRRVYGLTGTANTAGSTVSRVSGDGSVVVYSWDASKSAYIATDGAGAYDKLTYASSVWTWTDGDSQATESYAAYGTNSWRITRAADTDGNALTFTYSGANLSKVTTADGSWVQYSWSGDHITQITTGYTDLATSTAATLTRTRYGYDSSDRLTSVTVDLSPQDNSITDGKVYTTTYTYDGASKRVATISETDGSKLAIAYDTSGRVASLTQTVASGVTRATTIAYGSGYTNVTDATGQVTRLDYNADGTLKKVTMPPAASGAAAQTLQYSYTATGDVHTITDAAGKVTTFGYDAWGNVTSQTDPLGNVVTRTYGTKNQLLTETTTASDTASAAAAHTTRYVYDGEDHLRYVLSPQGEVTEYRYTSYGQLQYVIGYPEQTYSLAGLGATAAPTEAQVNAWRDALPDRSSTEISYNGYDARGAMIWTIDYGAATTTGGTSTAEGYNRTYFTYDQAGKLLSRYRLGQATETFVYDGLGRMTASTDVNGGTTHIVFNDASNQTVVTLASGLVTTSTYNKAGELLSLAQSGSFVAGGTTSYVYDQLGRPRVTTDQTGYKHYAVYDDAGRKVADVDHYGDLTEYRYDADNRVVATVDYATKLSAATLTTLADPNADVAIASIRPTANTADLWTWQVYDADGRVVEAIDGAGGAVAYAYDGAGQLIRTTDYHNKLSASQLATFKTTPPATAVLPTADAANDAVARSFYDVDGQLAGTLDGEGYLTRNVYDHAGQLVEQDAYATITTASYRASGTFAQLLASVGSSASDRQTHYVYGGRALRYVVDSLDQVTEYDYNYAGQVTHAAAYAGSIASTTDYTFDSIKSLVSASGLATNAATRNSWSVYDAAGRLAYAIDGEGAVTAYGYDSSGNVIKTVEYATKRSTGSLPSAATMDSWSAGQASNAANRVTHNYYTARGELRYTVDAEGYVSRIDYDAAGRNIAVIRWNAAITVSDATTITEVSALTTGSNVLTRKTYDAAGRLNSTYDGAGIRTVLSYNANGTIASQYRDYGGADQSITTYAYDGAGRTITQTDAYGTAAAATTHYAYDGLGNLVSTTDADGNVTTYAYDQLGQLLTATDALGKSTTYTYNAFGDQVKVVDARGDASWNYYDDLGRLISSRDAENYVTETAYDAFGDIASVTRRYNKATNTASTTALPVYTANAAHDAVTAFLYDRLGRLVKTTDALGAYEQYTLDAFGNRTAVRNKLGATTTYTYDRRGLQTSETLPISSVKSNGATEASSVTNRFAYDARGNLITKTEASGLTEQRVTSYVYDAADRLTETHLPQVVDGTTGALANPVEHLKYDRRGNLVESDDAMGARSLYYYDALDRVTAKIDALGGYTSYTYDDNGNMLTSRAYATAVALPATAGGTPPSPSGAYRQTSYSYDALNRLLTTSVAGVLTGSWNGSAYATNASTTITTTLAYDAMGNVITTTDADGGKVFSYYDKLGRKTAQVDQGKYLTKWTYDGEGNALTERRYATAATGTISSTAPPSVATNAADRLTTFTYDKLGNRLTETRADVAAYTISATNGALTALPATTDSTVTYTYNALGQVLTKKQATGDTFTYTYDTAGRLTTETRTAYADQTGASVTPTLRYYYDGLGDLTRSQQGNSTANASTDHITTYAYGAGGRLASTTDATGFTHDYAYDLAGRTIRDSYARMQSGGTAITEAKVYGYDALGRMTMQTNARLSGSTWVNTDEHGGAYDAVFVRYDAFGEVTGRGVSTSIAGAPATYQEQFNYDGAGRLASSNAGDGVWRFYLYDANGNQTLAFASTGADLSAYIATGIKAKLASTGDSTLANTVTTVNIYDARGQLVGTRSPDRQLSSSTTQTLITSKGYNAFGELASETDARGNTTTYAYNNIGRLTSKVMPLVSVTDAQGGVSTTHPTETYFYDIGGRLIGTQDADGNRTARLLVAGTGYDGGDALVAKEFHPDGGVFTTLYDVFGDARILRNELYTGSNTSVSDELHAYDKADRLVSVAHRGGLLTDYYSYDGLGQRIRSWNSLFNPSSPSTPTVYDRTDYDAQGRITQQIVAYGSSDAATTKYAYSWSASLATTGLGAFGGWTKTTTNTANLTATEKDDYFGHVVASTDFGGHATSYGYDKGARLLTTGEGGETLTNSWYDTGLLAGTVDSGGTSTLTSSYGYDADGNRTFEAHSGSMRVYTSGSASSLVAVDQQEATITYDALDRMTSYTDAGDEAVSATYEYDAAGNARHIVTSYPDAAHPQYADVNTNFWYAYDAMNRMVVVDGRLLGTAGSGTIARGVGTDLTYDLAGRRVTATMNSSRTANLWQYMPSEGPHRARYYDDDGPRDVPDDGGGKWSTVDYSYSTPQVESYTYTADGYLAQVSVAVAPLAPIGDLGTYSPSAADTLDPAVPRATYTRDALGRTTGYVEYLDNGTTVSYSRTAAYNKRGEVTSDSVSQRDAASKVTVTSTTYDYKLESSSGVYAGAYAGGTVTHQHSSVTYNGAAQPATDTKNTITWYDAAEIGAITYKPNSTTTYTTTNHYDGLGRLAWSHIADGRPREVSFLHDSEGRVLQRVEKSAAATNPEDWHYFVAGRQIGSLTSNDDMVDNYTDLIRSRSWTQGTGPFAYGDASGVTGGDFDQSYDAVMPGVGGWADGDYTATGGETLAQVADTLWGDAGLWYLLAQANGLGGDTVLAAGQRLTVPAKVTNLHNNAGTFKPYDPDEALGNLSPSAIAPKPKAAHKHNCGAFGAILTAVIAVAASALLPGGGILGVIEAAGVDAASQGVGIALGLQDKFNWSQLATAGLTAGIGDVASFGEIAGSKFLGNVASAALTNAAVQGVEVATGLQSKFDWAGVAAAGIGAGVGGAVGHGFHAPQSAGAAFGQRFAVTAANDLANAATRSVLTGTDFGDNVLAALPDVIGQTLGGFLADGISGRFAGFGVETAAGDAGSGLPDWLKNPSLLVPDPRPITDLIGDISLPDLSAGSDTIGVGASGQAVAETSGPDIVVYGGDVDLTRYFREVVPTSREQNDATVAQDAVFLRARTDISADEKDRALTALFNRGSYWDSILPASDAPFEQQVDYDFSKLQWRPFDLSSVAPRVPASSITLSQLDQMEASPLAAIGFGVANMMNATPQRTAAAINLGEAANGLLLGIGGMAGARVPGVNNQLEFDVVNGENGIHANSRLSTRTTYLYELQTSDGQFLKYGISVNPDTRYSNSFMVGKRIIPITSGTRSDMLAVERQMVISNPGPLNNEPWAVKARGGN